MISRRLVITVLVGALAATTNLGARAEEPPPPRAGCPAEVADPTSDAWEHAADQNTTVRDQKLAADPKLDMTEAFIGSKGRTLIMYVKMPNADGKSTAGFGPRWDVEIFVPNPEPGKAAKQVLIVHGIPDSAYQDKMPSFPMMYVDSDLQTDAKFTAKFDAATKYFILTVDLDDLEGRTFPLEDGLKFSKFNIATKQLGGTYVANKQLTNAGPANGVVDQVNSTVGGLPSPPAASPAPSKWPTVPHVPDGTSYETLVEKDRQFDRLPDSSLATSELQFTVGYKGCFAPPPAKLENLTGKVAQYGDAAKLSVKLSDNATGTPLAGEDVTFAIDGKSVTAPTNAAGVATGSLLHGKAAGEYPLTVTFAGDDEHDVVTLTDTLKVVEEKTTFAKLKIVKKGTSRVVTITLVDDDRPAHGVSSQKVYWYVGSTKFSKNTNRSGQVTFTTVAGKTISAEFKKVTGKYLGAKSAKTKLT